MNTLVVSPSYWAANSEKCGNSLWQLPQCDDQKKIATFLPLSETSVNVSPSSVTKMYENVYFTTLKKGYNGELKGEFVIIVEGNNNANSDLNNLNLTEHLQFYIGLGNSKNDAMKLVAKDRGVSKSEIYKELLNN